MTGEVSNDVVAEAIRIRLDHCADHRQRTARLDRLDGAHGRLVRALDQQSVFRTDVTGQEGGVGVAVYPVDVGGDVDIHDVAIGNDGRVRDAVADDLIQRGAAGLRETLVTQRRRVGAVVDHVVMGDPVQFIGGDTGCDGVAGLGQRTGGNATGNAHLLDHLRRLHPGLTTLRRGGTTDVLGPWNRLRHRQER